MFVHEVNQRLHRLTHFRVFFDNAASSEKWSQILDLRARDTDQIQTPAVDDLIKISRVGGLHFLSSRSQNISTIDFKLAQPDPASKAYACDSGRVTADLLNRGLL
ncbi:hypothetical protein D3C78_1623050 [compost metagenome]